MFRLVQICFILMFSIFFIGCSLIDIKQIIIDTKDKNLVNEDTKNNCNKYIKSMNYAAQYIEKEFEDAYFVKKDILGAKAQLFLIENNSPTLFAKNINAANDSYNTNYELAKKNSCDISGFKTAPFVKLKESIKSFENKDKK
ncbi:hypothetical protein [Arcobacter sp.]|uniref:hypothetical protein n=1 Tax=Arcobacter sp. TaxID=1872629 RepID=UPI003D0E2B6D